MSTSVLDRLVGSINILNLLLLAAVAALGACLIGPSGQENGKVPAEPQSSVPALQSAAKAETEKTDRDPSLSMSDFLVVAEKNLFHGERSIPPEKTGEAVLPKPEIVLFGTMVSDDVSLAFIEDKKSPKTTPGRGKRQTALKKGEVVSGFQLISVESDRIVLTRGEDSMTVHLTDSEKRKDGAAQQSAAATRNPSGKVSGPTAQTLLPPLPRQPIGTAGVKGQSPTPPSTRGGR
jgi:hypothetical protein